METLQKFLPFFQEQLQQWYQLTLHNQEYATFLALLVCLITAFFYSIRIGFLKRSHALVLKAKHEIQLSLNDVKQQLDTAQQQYQEAKHNMQQAIERAEAESQRLHLGNRKLSEGMSGLIGCFELNYPNPPTADAENLLTEYDAVLARVQERFQAEQQAKTQLQLAFHAETAKLSEKEMLVVSLQNRLDSQTQQLAKLELAVEHYQDAQRQLEADKQQLAREVEIRQSQAAQQQPIAEPKPVVAQTQVPVVENTVAVQIAAERIQQPEEVTPVVTKSAPPAAVLPPVSTAPVETKQTVGKERDQKKGLFGRAMAKIAKIDEKFGGSPEVKPDTIQADPKVIEPEPAPVAEPDPQVIEAQPAQENLIPENGLQKLSGMFGGFKKSGDKPVHAEEVKPKQPQIEPEKPVAKANKVPAQLSGLFAKLKPKK